VKGRELYDYYRSKRDYSGSEEDRYAQLMETLHFHIHEKLYPLVEKAEAEGKRLDVRSPDEDILYDDIDESMVILV